MRTQPHICCVIVSQLMCDYSQVVAVVLLCSHLAQKLVFNYYYCYYYGHHFWYAVIVIAVVATVVVVVLLRNDHVMSNFN